MSEQATVQTVSDDEPSEDDEDMHVEEQFLKKRKITGAAAHKCLKRVEGNRVRLTMEQKAKLSVFAADHSHLSRQALINWAVKEFDLKETPAPSLITSLKKDAKVEWAKNYLPSLQETVSKKLQSKSAKKCDYAELKSKLYAWFTRLEHSQAVVTDELLREKALAIAAELKETEFKASRNWIVIPCNTRQNLSYMRAQGNKGSNCQG
jgi:hypothetical protein